jgi:CheY-like chemotaxis protein
VHFNSTNKNIIWNNTRNGLFNNYYNDQFCAIDTIKIDDHSRFTFTKMLKKVFPVQSGDTIAVYQNKQTDEIILSIQRSSSILGTWICKKSQDLYKGDYYHILEKMDENNLIPKVRDEHERYNNLQQQVIQKTTKRSDNSFLRQENTPNIMIVDDEEDILLSFKTFFEDNNSLINVNTETFKSSQEALLRFVESHYDLVIIDVRLPGINGIQLCKIMRSIRPDIKVLFISALESAEEFITMLPGIRPSDIIKKPFDMECLIEKVKDVLNN